MISQETIEQFTKVVVDNNAATGERSRTWEQTGEVSRRNYMRAVTEGFRSIGVKVEGDPE